MATGERKLKYWSCILGVLIIMASMACVPQRKLEYLRDSKKELKNVVKFNNEAVNDDIIQSGDELFINVASSDEGSTHFTYMMGTIGVADVSLLSYPVDKEGFIKIPYVGKTQVADLTLYEASEKIEKELAQYLYLPSVNIRFVNKNIAIIGEVTTPGMYTFYMKKLNILQAIGYANDITTFGDRKNVLLVRTESDSITRNYIDLTNVEVLESDEFYIKPNDIIYVRPLPRKKWGMETYPYGLVFSFISMTFLLFTFLGYSYY